MLLLIPRRIFFHDPLTALPVDLRLLNIDPNLRKPVPYPVPQSVPTSSDSRRYGLASHHDFDNPSKWFTVPDVPLLDEHELTGPNGEPEGIVDRTVLEEIARNNNRRVIETGDPATLILGHTSDDPRAAEKPAKGFVVNYKVKPFKRDPETGQLIYAIHGDYKVRPKNAHLIEEYPRRSVELWLNKREIDPVAMLGGTTPERDLSVVIRKARENSPSFDFASVFQRVKLANVVLDHRPRTDRERKLARVGEALHYAVRGGVMFRYAMGECAMPMPNRYGADDLDGETDDLDQDTDMGGDGSDDFGDDGADTGGGGGFDAGSDDGAGEDPVVAKVLASKPMRDLMDKVNQIFDAVTGGGEPGAPGNDMGAAPGGALGVMDDGMGMGAPGGAPPMGAAPPPGAGAPGGMGGNPDEEAAMFHGATPVRFEDGMDDPEMFSASGFGGPTSTAVPGPTGKRGKPFSRNGNTNHANGNGKGRTNVAPQTRTQPRTQAQNPDRVRLQRLEAHNRQLALKLARSEAKEAVAALKAEGVMFGETPEDAAKEEAAKIELLAQLDDESRAFMIQDMRRNYKRVDTDPAGSQQVGPARFARPVVDNGPDGGSGNDEPQTPQEAMMAAEIMQTQKKTLPEAIKYLRSQKPRGRR